MAFVFIFIFIIHRLITAAAAAVAAAGRLLYEVVLRPLRAPNKITVFDILIFRSKCHRWSMIAMIHQTE